MMKMFISERSGVLSAIGVLFLLAFTSVATAQEQGKDRSNQRDFEGRAIFSERMADRLNLDDVQRQTIRNIVDAAKPEMQALRERIRANKEGLSALDAADANYAANLQNLAMEKGSLATEQTLLRHRVRNDIAAVLNEEQLAALEARKNRGRDGRRGGKSGRR